MHILTGAAMREADRRAIEDVGIPGRVLMESAGRAVVRVMEERIPDFEDLSISVVCGKGNNGGDGLVVLRTLLGLGYEARGWVLSPFEDLSPDAIDNLQVALKLGLPVDSVPTEKEWDEALTEVAIGDVVVDAILGTGLTQAARGLPARVIRDLNAVDAVRVAVDVPSGLSAETGAVPGPAFEADLTVALAAPKVSHFIPPASELCGHVEVVDIGIPAPFLVSGEPSLRTSEPEALRLQWPERDRSTHKGSFGHLLLLAGSVGKTGAAVMAAEAALRAGAGLVTVASAASAIPMMAPQIPEVMWEPLPETESGAPALDALARLRHLLAGRSAFAVGPGLGLHDETVELVRRLVTEVEIPTVIDADGLNALAGHVKELPSGRRLALTPHPGEAGRLLGRSGAAIQEDRIGAARELAREANSHVLLKGFRTLICDPSGNLHVNLTGNAGMATGGTGDVLTGIVGGLLAQGVPVNHALALGAHVHGLAGDLAASELGEAALLATDVTRKLAEATKELLGS